MLFGNGNLGGPAALFAAGGVCPPPFQAAGQDQDSFAEYRVPAVFTTLVVAEQVLNPDQFERLLMTSKPHRFGPSCGAGRCSRCADVDLVRQAFTTSTSVRLVPALGGK